MNERLITARELAEHLGVRPGTVLDWFEAKQIPGFKLGRAVRFRPSEVEAWLQERRRGPVVDGGSPPRFSLEADTPATPGEKDFGRRENLADA